MTSCSIMPMCWNIPEYHPTSGICSPGLYSLIMIHLYNDNTEFLQRSSRSSWRAIPAYSNVHKHIYISKNIYYLVLELILLLTNNLFMIKYSILVDNSKILQIPSGSCWRAIPAKPKKLLYHFFWIGSPKTMTINW